MRLPRQAAQFPGASTAEGKGNAAGGPSEVRQRLARGRGCDWSARAAPSQRLAG